MVIPTAIFMFGLLDQGKRTEPLSAIDRAR
jgi:hypothetical protein